jgi:hypothetical protein
MRVCGRSKVKEYSDKNKKVAYEQLRVNLPEIDPEATKEAVVKKINSLRSCFRKQLKKVEDSVNLCARGYFV